MLHQTILGDLEALGCPTVSFHFGHGRYPPSKNDNNWGRLLSS
jgi:hypothetical protein